MDKITPRPTTEKQKVKKKKLTAFILNNLTTTKMIAALDLHLVTYKVHMIEKMHVLCNTYTLIM